MPSHPCLRSRTSSPCHCSTRPCLSRRSSQDADSWRPSPFLRSTLLWPYPPAEFWVESEGAIWLEVCAHATTVRARIRANSFDFMILNLQMNEFVGRGGGAIVRRHLVRPNRHAFEPGTILSMQRQQSRFRRSLLGAAWTLSIARHSRGSRTHKRGSRTHKKKNGEREVLTRAAGVRFQRRCLPGGGNRLPRAPAVR